MCFQFLSSVLLLCQSAVIPESVTNHSVADLVRRQTDTIKKIVSSHHSQTHHLDYPVVTKYPADDTRQKTSNKESLDELKIKCEHLARLANQSHQTQAQIPVTPKPRPNAGGFYVTTDLAAPPPSTTPTPTTRVPPPVKYIKLEPIILQKTILNDGRTIYYWHKSLPSAVQFVPPPPPPPAAIPTPTTTTTTTTTESSYSFRNFFPSFYAIGGNEPSTSTTTEKTPTAEQQGEELIYQQQMRFVVPVPYAPPNTDTPVKRPWDFDQYAYYPKSLQPETMNVEMPYVPTFHVINAVAVPNSAEDSSSQISEH